MMEIRCVQQKVIMGVYNYTGHLNCNIAAGDVKKTV